MKIYDYCQAYELGMNEIGAKAFSICAMHKYGVPTPNGIVITNDNILKLQKALPEERLFLAEKIKKSVSALTYAIRSSAVGEDSHSLSWAGCFESFLDVDGEYIVDATLKCFQSLNNARSRAYRHIHGTNKLNKMSIVIQEYVRSEYHGVCFTANPISGNNEEIVVEYQSGCSGAVVNGCGVPETIFVNKNGADDEEVLKNTPDFLWDLIVLSRKIEKFMGCLVDIEWVAVNKNIIITQARPLTAL